MFGRLGSMYFLHLAEAEAQRRRLAESNRSEDANLVVFLRLIGVIALGLGGAGLVSMALA